MPFRSIWTVSPTEECAEQKPTLSVALTIINPNDLEQPKPCPLWMASWKPSALVVLPTSCSPSFVFGNPNQDASTVVFRIELPTPMPSCRIQIERRIDQLKQHCNAGFNVVPIINSFTSVLPVSGSQQQLHFIDQLNLDVDILSMVKQPKMSSKNRQPPSPLLPSADKVRLEGVILYQVGFVSGRQGLFQSLATSRMGEDIHNLLNQYVILGQDDGLDLGQIRGFEFLKELVGGIPECPFMPILRLARHSEVHCLTKKHQEELHLTRVAQQLVKERPHMIEAGMRVVYCELQFDRKKMIVFAHMHKWVKFNEFVKSLFGCVEKLYGYQPRVFIQRKFD